MVLNTVAHELSEPCFNFVLLFVSINVADVMRSETLIMSEGEVCNNTTFALQLIQVKQLVMPLLFQKIELA